jgi:hypothetical protein
MGSRADPFVPPAPAPCPPLRSVRLLEKHGLVFDIHLNSFQAREEKGTKGGGGTVGSACSCAGRYRMLPTPRLRLLPLTLAAFPSSPSLPAALQMRDAASFLAAYPGLTVVINHLGCPFLPRGDPLEQTGRSDAAVATIAEWRAGMRALAALPHVYMKVSGLDFVTPHWMAHPAAHAVVKVWKRGRESSSKHEQVVGAGLLCSPRV